MATGGILAHFGRKAATVGRPGRGLEQQFGLACGLAIEPWKGFDTLAPGKEHEHIHGFLGGLSSSCLDPVMQVLHVRGYRRGRQLRNTYPMDEPGLESPHAGPRAPEPTLSRLLLVPATPLC